MQTFDNLFVLGRPAGGKSELIDFMKKVPVPERAEKYHIGAFEEVDDFPWIWEVCSQDDEREARGERRLCSEKTEEGHNLTVPNFRGSLIGRFNKVITEKYLSRPEFYREGTLLIEFARGRGDGFKNSLDQFKRDILERAAILYIDVSFQESFRRNNARYNAALKSSILCHKVPDKDMYEYFIENDWKDITDGRPDGNLVVNGVAVPFVSMNNEPELPPGPEIAERYKKALDRLFETV